jgi:hypothetical protein
VLNVNALLEFSEELLDTLEKTAAEADALSLRNAQLTAQLEKAAAAPVVQAARPFDKELLTKLAHQLEREGLLQVGMTVDNVVQAMNTNPNLLAKLAFSLVTPVTEGQPIVSSIPSSGEKEANVVEFDGRLLVDHEGWLNALTS